jgi:tetratricopeptide (TPR) repeat protein
MSRRRNMGRPRHWRDTSADNLFRRATTILHEVTRFATARQSQDMLQRAGRLERELCLSRLSWGSEAWLRDFLIGLLMDNAWGLDRKQFPLSRIIAFAEEVVRQRPRSASARVDLGIAYQRDRRAADAARQFELAMEIDPNSIDPWGPLGGCYLELGQPEEARRCFERVIELRPSCPEERIYRSCALLLVGRWGEGWREQETRLLNRNAGRTVTP